MSRLEREQKISFWVAVVSAALGFMTSAGCRMLPDVPSGWTGVLHGLLVVLGVVAGLLAVGITVQSHPVYDQCFPLRPAGSERHRPDHGVRHHPCVYRRTILLRVEVVKAWDRVEALEAY